MQIRNRIRELRHVRAADLRPNPNNWRTHSIEQRNALRGVLAEIGYADALIARETEDGGLELIDGHLRAETTPDQIVPVLVLDVTAEEADQLLATLDPLAGMAGKNDAALGKLLEQVDFRSDAVKDMLRGLVTSADEDPEDEVGEKPEIARQLEISPELFERQDYLVIAFDNQWDWQVVCERLGVETVANAVVDPKSTIRQKGLGRVVPAKRLLKELGYGTE